MGSELCHHWLTTRSIGIPCFGCGKLSTCTMHPDRSACKCWRDGGAIHRRNGMSPPPPPDRRRHRAPPVTNKLAGKQLVESIRNYQIRVVENDLNDLSRRLGVNPSSLHQLGIGWDGAAWTFPMFDGDGTPIGIHRRFPDGRKLCLSGSRLGLFFSTATSSGDGDRSPWDAGIGTSVTAHPHSGGHLSPPPMLLICEGASDTAAALTLGYYAVGVPSAGLGAELVVRFVQRTRPAQIIIVADLDEGSSTSSGKMTWPGIEGGLRLAERLLPLHANVRFCLPPPGVKDLRQWMGRDDTIAIRAALESSPRVNPSWMSQAQRNVLENRQARSEPSWSRRAAALLAGIEDVERRGDLRDRLEERAGIMEYDGNLPRDEAERLAFEGLSQLLARLAGGAW
jgi:hypothetical protein